MPHRRRSAEPWWVDLPFEELLQVRLCDLDLSIEGTALQARVEGLYDDLERAGLRFRPHVWLSTDWFTPDGSPGFAAPFYLAHRRLMRLEHKAMLEVEGGAAEWCRKLLRHECGHAIDNAYRLHRKKRWRETFGPYSKPYRLVYSARPSSTDHVLHLDGWYAQSHPAEDWAETFAVWLRPGGRWRRRYRDWGAMKKLRYVDETMADIADQRAPVRSRARPGLLSQHRETLAEHYRRRKQSLSNDERPWVYDRYLQRVFPERKRRHETATAFLRANAGKLRSTVSSFTGHPQYVVDQALRAMSARARETGLRRTLSMRDTTTHAAILLTTLAIHYAEGSKQRFHR